MLFARPVHNLFLVVEGTQRLSTLAILFNTSRHQDDYKEYEKQKASITEQADKAKEACKATNASCHWKRAVSSFDCGTSMILVRSMYTVKTWV